MINLHSGPDLIGSGVRNVGGSPRVLAVPTARTGPGRSAYRYPEGHTGLSGAFEPSHRGRLRPISLPGRGTGDNCRHTRRLGRWTRPSAAHHAAVSLIGGSARRISSDNPAASKRSMRRHPLVEG